RYRDRSLADLINWSATLSPEVMVFG
ncbi:MAG: hypothetical protein RLZZ381_1568, partial [Cyanobacteriota bacterium]